MCLLSSALLGIKIKKKKEAFHQKDRTILMLSKTHPYDYSYSLNGCDGMDGRVCKGDGGRWRWTKEVKTVGIYENL